MTGRDRGEAGTALKEPRHLAALPVERIEQTWQETFGESPMGMLLASLDGRLQLANNALCKMLGYETAVLGSMAWGEICHPEDAPDDQAIEELLAGRRRRFTKELRLITADGRILWGRVHVGAICDDAGRVCFYSSLIEDVTERHEAEQRFRSAFDDAAIGMAITSLRLANLGEIMQVNRALTNLLGVEAAGLVGRPLSSYVHSRSVRDLEDLWRRLVAGDGNQEGLHVRMYRGDGGLLWARLSASVARGVDGAPAYLLSHFQDITARRAAEERLIHQANHDPLTTLPNRDLLARRIDEALATSDPGDWPAVFFIDLDRFKLVNDTLGHAAGDELLVEVAGRLRQTVGPDDTVARLGGDEFVVLATSARTPTSAAELAQRMQGALNEPVEVAGRTLFMSASIGIAFPDIRSRNGEEVLRSADIAMYHAKTSGKARSALFDPVMQSGLESRLEIEQGLHQAVSNGRELVVWFQPIMSLVTGDIAAFEALVRWQRPGRGLLGPVEFIAVAEETGLILPLGEQVLETACAQVGQWEAAGMSSGVGVNLSARQLNDPGLERQILSTLERWQVNPAQVTLEVTETMLVDGTSRAADTVQRLQRQGLAIAIDDFGTGYSSLSYLRTYPVDVVKVDRSFIRAIDTNPRDAAIVEAIVQLAHALGTVCVAEGVETQAQLEMLVQLGCDQVQGYLIGRPAPASALSMATSFALQPR